MQSAKSPSMSLCLAYARPDRKRLGNLCTGSRLAGPTARFIGWESNSAHRLSCNQSFTKLYWARWGRRIFSLELVRAKEDRFRSRVHPLASVTDAHAILASFPALADWPR